MPLWHNGNVACAGGAPRPRRRPPRHVAPARWGRGSLVRRASAWDGAEGAGRGGGMKREDAEHTIERVASTSIDPDRLARGLDAIFFEASNTKSFESANERAAFRQRWLGRYLDDFPEWAYIARDAAGEVAGYLVGCVSDPAHDARFADIGYFAMLAAETARYPAHLHVNVRADCRGSGLGARLIAAFLADARRAGVAGVHVVTSEGARNVGFYLANGFSQVHAFRVGEKRLLMLGADLVERA